MADQAIDDRRCLDAAETTVKTLCSGWRKVEGSNLSVAFTTVELRYCDGHHEDRAEQEPTDVDLLEAGGSTLEDLGRLNPQYADELYSEFDFLDSSTDETAFVTLSYGERISVVSSVDFEPFVRRAEEQAERYHSFLVHQGETRCSSFRIIHREWFLANDDFVTVHVCFDR